MRRCVSMEKEEMKSWDGVHYFVCRPCAFRGSEYFIPGALNSNSSEGDSIKIFLRVRPPDPSSSESNFSTRVLDVNTSDKAIILKTKPEPKIFTYDNVGDDDITQENVFSIVGKNIIDSCIAGYNGTIFAYGQTGSGKTFTMLGPSENTDSFHHELRGVIPRSIEYLYSIIAQQQKESGGQKQFLCRCSFVEIYQEHIFDLLDPTSQGLHLRENLNKGVFVDGLIEKVVCGPNEAYKVLISGWLNRRVAATSMNRESSRSHAVFTINIESKEDAHSVQTIRGSCLNLVDLAGSERQKDTHTAGVHLKEAGSINRSLHVLGTVIMSLVDLSRGKKRHIPYRDSKLTFLLKDSLGGNAKTHMVACVHPDSRCFGETLSTLNFARSAKLIKNKAVVNEDFRGCHLELQKEICRLKELLETVQNTQPVCNQSVLNNLSTADADLNADSVWKKCFIEAMYFREASENDKKGLQGVIKHLQDLCEKKEKYNQSTKMIIKFRENTIQNLQKQAQSRSEDADSDDLKSLKEEIKILRQQMMCNPQLAKFSGENKNLRIQLEQMEASRSVTDVLSDVSHIDELEKLFKELTLLKESGTKNAFNGPKDSPSKDKFLAEAVEKHKMEVKGCHKEIESLKQSLLDMEKKTESERIIMDIELVSCRNMISELERMLEAHQLKTRTENNALKDLHCQTLKVMTTPTLYSRKNSLCPGWNDSVCSSRKDSICSLNQSVQLEDDQGGITDSVVPQNLVDDSAQDALLEELQTLTAENNKLQQNIDENESELLKLKQEVDKKELQFNQLKSVLEKERNEFSDHMASENALRKDLEVLKQDLKWQREENADLQIILTSADKQLKDEKTGFKNCQQNAKLEKQMLETQLAHKTLELERSAKEYDETLKELACLKEEMETSLTTKIFYENRAEELEQALHQEIKDRERLETKLETMKSAEDVASLQRSLDDVMEDAKSKLDSKELELCTLKSQLAEKDGFITENKDIVSNLMSSMQEMKCKLNESQASCTAWKMECLNSSQELEELRRDLDATSAEIASLQTELKERCEKFQLDLQKKEFEIENLQEDQDSNSDSILALKQALDVKENQVEEKDQKIQDLQLVLEELKTKMKLQEMEINNAQLNLESFESFKFMTSEKIKSVEVLLTNKEEEVRTLLSKSESANACLENGQEENKTLKEQIKSVEVLLTNKEEEVRTLLSKSESANACLENGQEENKKLKEQIKSVEVLLTNKEEEVKTLLSKSESANTCLENGQEENKKLKEQIKSVEVLLTNKEEEVRTLLSKSESVNACLESGQEENKKLKEQIKSVEVLLTNKEEEVRTLLSKSESANACLENGQEENKKLKEQFESLQLQMVQVHDNELEMGRLKLELRKQTEEKDKLMDELHKERETAARLIGHSNHQQKIKLMDKKNQEYQELKERYMDLEKEHNKCLWRKKSTPHDSSLHKMEDITNTSLNKEK